jgi:hypothetical protein
MVQYERQPEEDYKRVRRNVKGKKATVMNAEDPLKNLLYERRWSLPFTRKRMIKAFRGSSYMKLSLNLKEEAYFLPVRKLGLACRGKCFSGVVRNAVTLTDVGWNPKRIRFNDYDSLNDRGKRNVIVNLLNRSLWIVSPEEI